MHDAVWRCATAWQAAGAACAMHALPEVLTCNRRAAGRPASRLCGTMGAGASGTTGSGEHWGHLYGLAARDPLWLTEQDGEQAKHLHVLPPNSFSARPALQAHAHPLPGALEPLQLGPAGWRGAGEAPYYLQEAGGPLVGCSLERWLLPCDAWLVRRW